MKTVRDPVCGMDIDKETVLSAKIGNRPLFLCNHLQSNLRKSPPKYAGNSTPSGRYCNYGMTSANQ